MAGEKVGSRSLVDSNIKFWESPQISEAAKIVTEKLLGSPDRVTKRLATFWGGNIAKIIIGQVVEAGDDPVLAPDLVSHLNTLLPYEPYDASSERMLKKVVPLMYKLNSDELFSSRYRLFSTNESSQPETMAIQKIHSTAE